MKDETRKSFEKHLRNMFNDPGIRVECYRDAYRYTNRISIVSPNQTDRLVMDISSNVLMEEQYGTSEELLRHLERICREKFFELSYRSPAYEIDPYYQMKTLGTYDFHDEMLEEYRKFVETRKAEPPQNQTPEPQKYGYTKEDVEMLQDLWNSSVKVK